jgi:hypothetical protein
MPELFDVVELTVDIPEHGLCAGMQGTIVHCHSGSYEAEFSNGAGETLDFLSLVPEQFIVVWRARLKSWVPLRERIALLMDRLHEEEEREILDLDYLLHARKHQSLTRLNAV